MNPKLALPLVLSVVAFGFALQQTQRQTNDSETVVDKETVSYSMYSNETSETTETDKVAVTAPPASKMLSAKEAKEKISSQLGHRDQAYRALSRVRIRLPAELTSVEILNPTLPTAPYFLGALKVKYQEQERIAPFQIDRVTGKTLLFINSVWVGIETVDTSGIFTAANVPKSLSAQFGRIQLLTK